MNLPQDRIEKYREAVEKLKETKKFIDKYREAIDTHEKGEAKRLELLAVERDLLLVEIASIVNGEDWVHNNFPELYNNLALTLIDRDGDIKH